MNILVILLFTIAVFLIAYRIYGRYIDKIFGCDDKNPTPAYTLRDDRDYVPTKGLVVFSHHFASIAGGGPIIGPAIALLYGFYPSWLWILFGAILIGAVHDFTSLFVSIREKGKSIADVTHRMFGRFGYSLFVFFVIMMLILVTSAFLQLSVTALTSFAPLSMLKLSPENTSLIRTVVDPATGVVKAKIGGIASTSVLVITAFAPIIGFLLYRKEIKVWIASILAIAVCVFSIFFGLLHPVTITPEAWMIILTLYVFLAAGLPVWLVLQPRDFTNSFILYAGIVVLAIGTFIGGLQGLYIHFPSFSIAEGSAKIGPIWPMLFITIACGAISGFHSLVAGGTVSKQIQKESIAKRIGYGGMLLEGLLAVGVLIAIGSCLNRSEYMDIVFPVAQGVKSNPILAFSLSLGQLSQSSLHIPMIIGTVFGILLVEGFVVTTLDTSIRLNRYLLEELWFMVFEHPPKIFRSYLFNAGIVTALMYLFAYKNAFLAIWPIFGSVNQLLAALTLITISVWLLKKGKNAWFTVLPAIFMFFTTVGSLIYLLFTKYIPDHNMMLATVDIILLLLSGGLAMLGLQAKNQQRNPCKIDISS